MNYLSGQFAFMFLAAAQAAEVAGKTGGLFSWENLIRNPFFGHAHRPYHQGLQPR